MVNYLYWVALLTLVVVVDKSALYFVNNLSKNIRKHPDPYIRQRIFHPTAHPVLLIFSPFLTLIQIGQPHENQTQGYHDSVDHQLSYFCVYFCLPLQCPNPWLTINMKIPSYPRQKNA